MEGFIFFFTPCCKLGTPISVSLQSVDLCLICAVKNDNDDPIVEKVSEVSVELECETKDTSRRCDNDEKEVIDEGSTQCPST